MDPRKREQLVEDFNSHINLSEIMDDLITSVGENLKPDEVFDDTQLQEWAEDNGYTKSED